MNIRSRVLSWAFGKEIAKIQARYEAAYWNLSRSYLPGYIQSAREDITTLSRQETLRRVRYFEKNSAVLLKILGILDINVVGSGITPTPRTTNMAWNKDALEWWNKESTVLDITGHSDVTGMQSIAFRGECVDGDSLIRLTNHANGRPAVEVVEAHRCTDGGYDVASIKSSGFRVVDGVVVDRVGRPAMYLIASDFDASTITPFPASQVVHVFDKKRAGQYRGVTKFHAAILDLHDLDDLQKYEMRAAKDAASITKIVEMAAGATTPDGELVGGGPLTNQQTIPGARDAYYRQTLGGETLLTQPGDKFNQYKGERPSAATTGFWDKLDRKIVQGSGVSYAALVDYSGNWGGATLRAAVTSDNRLYNLHTLKQAAAWQRVYEYAIQWAMDHGELPKNPEFRNVRWHPPRRTTVDIGHESAAMLEEMKAGVRTFEGVYGEQGDDWRERLEQRATEEQFIEALATKYGVPRQYISSFAMERLSGQAPDALPGAVSGTPGANGTPGK